MSNDITPWNSFSVLGHLNSDINQTKSDIRRGISYCDLAIQHFATNFGIPVLKQDLVGKTADQIITNFRNSQQSINKQIQINNNKTKETSPKNPLKTGKTILLRYLSSSMYIRVLRRTTILYAGSMVFALAICVTFLLPQETKKLPQTPQTADEFKQNPTEHVLYVLLRLLQICGPLFLAIGSLMLALGCCSKTLEHPRGNFNDIYENKLNNDGETIHSEEDRKLVDDFRDQNAKEEDRLAIVNAKEQARQFNKDHGDFLESDPDEDYRSFKI